MTTRPVILIPVWGFSALGFYASIQSCNMQGFSKIWKSITPAVYGRIILFSISVAAVYIINQIADIEADKRNGGLPLIASGKVSIRSSIVVLVICSSISIIIPLLVGDTILVYAALLTILLGYGYSVKPFRFSGKPMLDFLSNGVGYGIIAFGVGWSLDGLTPFSSTFLKVSLPYFFLMCAGSISSTIPDICGDRQDKKITTAVLFGINKSHTLALLFLLIAGIIGIGNHDYIVVICTSASLPFYLGFYIFNNSFFMEATYKIGGGLCMIIALLILPLFIPLSFLVFFITWLYFRIRHGISYPSLVSTQSHETS